MSGVGFNRDLATKPKPPKPSKGWRSGWCGLRAEPWQHDRCPVFSPAETPCCCSCHDELEAIVLPAGQRVTDQATEVIPAGGYLSPEWHEARRTTVSASEIAAVLGLSTWTSPFDLWWLKRTGVDSQPENAAMRRGKRVERLILEDFTEAHPELTVRPAGLCVNNERQWQACTPDGLAYDGDPALVEWPSFPEPVAVVEAKNDHNRDAWGEEGTDDIPVAYRCQTLWQMDTLGVSVAYVPMWLGTDYREYVVEYHEGDVRIMREAAEAFLTSVREDRMPDIDSHSATSRRLKRLHPELVDRTAPVPITILRQHQTAKRLKKAAEDRMRLAENRVRALAGPAATIAAVGDGGQVLKTFSHTRSDIKERTQVVRAHSRDLINFPRKDV
ncbi:MAG TPA: YqaJ viral recombinase family protein [Propionibacteriaceae bacterium]|jgi:putative phage-type endonuclease